MKLIWRTKSSPSTYIGFSGGYIAFFDDDEEYALISKDGKNVYYAIPSGVHTNINAIFKRYE